MALPHAILVSLSEQAGSGYELARCFAATPVASPAPESSVGYFWAATHQQIYRTLRGAAYGDVDALRAQVATLRTERAGLLATYRGFAGHQFPDPSALQGAAVHQHLVLRGGILTEEGSLRWLDEVLATWKGAP